MAFKSVIGILLFSWASLAQAATTRDDLKVALSEHLTTQYGSVAHSPLRTGILLDLVAPLVELEQFDGTSAAAVSSFAEYVQAAHELRRAALTSSVIPAHEYLREIRQQAQRTDAHPLSLLLFDYQRVRSDAEQDDVLQFDGARVTAIEPSALQTGRTAVLGLLHDWTYHGADVAFSLADVYTNLGDVSAIEVDCGDGAGFRLLPKSGVARAHYSETGDKIITVRAQFRSGLALFGRARFEVRHLDAPPPSETWTLTASHSTGGSAATGEAYILYGAGHTMVERPVVLVEGLDLDNSLNWNELYDLMNQELLIETLLATGYDAVVLNYSNSTIAIQDNGFLVQELIEELNSATGAVHPLIIAGTSLGGLTSRYALTYMEHYGLPHNVGTFISVDSPQNGANIPVGVQFWADFFADEAAEAAAARDALLNPAPRQLLLYHLSSSAGGVANPDPMFAAFQNELAALGDYPTQPRLVSVINGSSTQQNSGFLPGAQIIRWVYDSFLVDIRGNVWAVSNTVNTRVLQGEINVIWPLPDTFRNVFIQPCLPWDNAPGGLTATMAELAAVPAPYGDIEALYPSHCFIPSVSALDLAVNDPFFNIAGAGNLYELTPFDSVYFPIANQDHVQITPENAAWFMSEIIGPLAPPELTISVEADSIRLRWSPVFAATSYEVQSSLDGVDWPTAVATNANEWAAATTDSTRYYQVIAVRN